MGIWMTPFLFAWMPVLESKDRVADSLKVACIYIVGTEHTPDYVIRDLLKLYPGQTLDMKDVSEAQQRLSQSGYFLVDREKGIEPRISVLDSDSGPFRDLLIVLQERPYQPSMLPQVFILLVLVATAILSVATGYRIYFNRRKPSGTNS